MTGSRVRTPEPPVLRGLGSALFAPVDAASLVAFRIAFGVVMLKTSVEWAVGGVVQTSAERSFHFAYFGFGWADKRNKRGFTSENEWS